MIYEPIVDDKLCELVIMLGKEGKSFAEMCAACDISKQLANIMRKNPEWDNALNLALTYREAFLNKMGFDNIMWTDWKGQPQFRVEIWKELRDDYREAEVKKDEAAISEAQTTVIEATKEYTEELHRTTI